MDYGGDSGQHEQEIGPLVQQERFHRNLLKDDEGDTGYQDRFKEDISRDTRCIQVSDSVESNEDEEIWQRKENCNKEGASRITTPDIDEGEDHHKDKESRDW